MIEFTFDLRSNIQKSGCLRCASSNLSFIHGIKYPDNFIDFQYSNLTGFSVSIVHSRLQYTFKRSCSVSGVHQVISRDQYPTQKEKRFYKMAESVLTIVGPTVAEHMIGLANVSRTNESFLQRKATVFVRK
ncbi:hypothetical protein LWI28_022771 [Acer negundo]|uniref:Uncharacterized protein n=1 Tax=Acer negundo TaxID=4023 RepID=A0AAD5JG52_ACENE|nr:hypothetical protein LWI28_022771 [Acer negundo]